MQDLDTVFRILIFQKVSLCTKEGDFADHTLCQEHLTFKMCSPTDMLGHQITGRIVGLAKIDNKQLKTHETNLSGEISSLCMGWPWSHSAPCLVVVLAVCMQSGSIMRAQIEYKKCQ